MKIAYLAPEIPSLSATFVYEELFALERRGISVVPISVLRPLPFADGQSELTSRTLYLYDEAPWKLFLHGLFCLIPCGARAVKSLKLLCADIVETGWLKMASWKLVYQFLAGAKVAGILKVTGCRHLHVHFAHVPAQIAMYASSLSDVPFTVTAHANDIFERGMLLKQKAARARRMLTISEYNQRYLEGIGIPRAHLAIVRCGVSFLPVSKSPQTTRPKVFRIGTLGRMVEKKGFDVLIHALARLKADGYQVELDIAGDGPLMQELISLAEALGVSRITHFAGSMPHHAVSEWLHQFDAFVLACKQDKQGDMDGIPVVLMEAMSQSIPVVSTRLSGIPELVMHEKTGLLAEPDNPVDLAHQISRLIESEAVANSLATNGCAHVASEFGQSVNIDRLIRYFGLPAI